MVYQIHTFLKFNAIHTQSASGEGLIYVTSQIRRVVVNDNADDEVKKFGDAHYNDGHKRLIL